MQASLYLQLDKPAGKLDQSGLVEKITGFIENENIISRSIL